jgi:hypothetical protein
MAFAVDACKVKKERPAFLKKSSKKPLRLLISAPQPSARRRQTNKSLFASFSSEKEASSSL